MKHDDLTQSPATQSAEELLLDWHLDRLDDRERAWVEHELLRDPEFRAKSDRLRAILRPLDHMSAGPTPLNLPGQVLAYVRDHRSGAADDVAGVPPDARDGVPRFPVPTGHGAGPARPRMPLRDMIAVAACIGLLVTVALPGLSGLRQRSRRQVCTNNLGAIYQGLGMYRQAFAGMLPFAGTPAGASWLPRGATDAPYASNSRHIYLLLRLNFGPAPDNFVCPSDPNAVPMRAGNYADNDDFASARNIGYDTLNVAGADAPTLNVAGTDAPTTNRDRLRPVASVAYAADANPLFVDGRFHRNVDPYATNSPTHRDGQCVLTLDGSAAWTTTPNHGPRHDNLWLAGSIRRYNGTETRQGRDDSFLVPGFPTAAQPR
ncbi:MAG: type IV pilin protein [Phycisphaerae bacterium]